MHRKARLTVFGRQLLVDRVETDGWTVARAAEAAGVTRQTATKGVRRYRACGLAGLEDRSSRPGRSPRALTGETVEAILVARHELGFGPHRLARGPRETGAGWPAPRSSPTSDAPFRPTRSWRSRPAAARGWRSRSATRPSTPRTTP